MAKLRPFAALCALVAMTTGTVLAVAATGAGAAPPPPPTDPYPAVPANETVCRAEKIKVDQAKLRYDQTLRDYHRAVAGGGLVPDPGW